MKKVYVTVWRPTPPTPLECHILFEWPLTLLLFKTDYKCWQSIISLLIPTLNLLNHELRTIQVWNLRRYFTATSRTKNSSLNSNWPENLWLKQSFHSERSFPMARRCQLQKTSFDGDSLIRKTIWNYFSFPVLISLAVTIAIVLICWSKKYKVSCWKRNFIRVHSYKTQNNIKLRKKLIFL